MAGSLEDLPAELRRELEQEFPSGVRRVASLDELPPNVREQVEQALADGTEGSSVVMQTSSVRVSGHTVPQAADVPPAYSCAECGLMLETPFDTCPQCGSKRRRSLWDRLLGR